MDFCLQDNRLLDKWAFCQLGLLVPGTMGPQNNGRSFIEKALLNFLASFMLFKYIFSIINLHLTVSELNTDTSFC